MRTVNRAFANVLDVLRYISGVILVVAVIYLLYWLFFSPRWEFWCSLEQLDPSRNPPLDILKNILLDDQFSGLRFASGVAIISAIIGGILHPIADSLRVETKK